MEETGEPGGNLRTIEHELAPGNDQCGSVTNQLTYYIFSK